MTTGQSLHWYYFLVDIALKQRCTIILPEAFYARQLCGAITGGGSMEMSELMQRAAMGASKMALIEWSLGARTLLVVLRRIAYVFLGTCLNGEIMFIVSGAVDVFVDLIILLLPTHGAFKLAFTRPNLSCCDCRFCAWGICRYYEYTTQSCTIYSSGGSPNGMLLAHVRYWADFTT